MPDASIIAFAALIASLVSFYFSHQLSVRSAIANVQPVLVFEYSAERGWVLRNIGRGPALNILIVHRRRGGDWFAPVRLPPLATDGTIVPAWLGHVNNLGLGVSYTDINARAYSSVTGNDLTTTHPRNVFPKWKESQIARHWDPNLLKIIDAQS